MSPDDPVIDHRMLRAARRYEALSGHSEMILWVMDAALRPTGPNAAWEAYTGQTRDQYGELGWLDAVHERDRQRCLQAIETNVPAERSFAIEVPIRRRDGVWRRHAVRAMPVRDEHGVLTEWIGTALDVEDARQGGERLAAAEQRLWLTHDAVGVGVWEWFPRTGELRWSAHMYRLAGIDPEGFRPSLEAWISCIHPDDVQVVTQEWVRAVKAGRHGDAITQEFRLLARDGTLRWITARSAVWRDAAGEIERVSGVNHDVTERRLLEEQTAAALREHRELRDRLLALTDGAEALLRAGSLAETRRAICDLAAGVLPADGYAVWGLDPAESSWRVVHGVGLSPHFIAQDVPGHEIPFTEPIACEILPLEGFAFREPVYREEGIQSLLSLPLPVHGVRRGALVAYYRARRRIAPAEMQVAVALGHLAAAAIGKAETLARQEQLLVEAGRHARRMAFLAEASTLLGGLDFETAFQRFAELAVPSLGDWCAIDVERDGRLQRVAVAHPDPEKLDRVRQLQARYPIDPDDPHGVGHVLRTGVSELHAEITDEQLAMAAKDAAHLELLRSLHLRSVIIAPLTARGRTLGVLTLVATSSRHFDPSDLLFVEELARRAAMAMDNVRLFEEAQRANRAKDDFLALLSHELRTPLNAILGWAQVLMNEPEAAEATRRRGLAIIQRNARVQAELVDGLLDVARVVTGGLPLQRQPIDLAEATAAVIEGVRPLAVERGLQLEVTSESPGTRVSADPNRFQQIAGNLLSNAIKFTEPGGRVQVTVRRAGRWGELEVADTGVGIEPEFLPYIFERFRQADSSPTRRHGGLGLGLWLVDELVRAHGGSVEAASAGPGQGSTFRVRLPLAPV